MNLHTNWLEARANTSPKTTAIIFQNQKITYQELYNQSQLYASVFHQRFADHTKIGIMLPNLDISIITLHALTLMDIEIVLINNRLSGSEINWQLEYLDVDVLISHSRYQTTLNELSDYVIHCIDEMTFLESQVEFTPQRKRLGDTLCYVFTSGTTGRPKAVPLSYGNFFFSAMSSAYHLGSIPDDTWLLTIPIFHLGGLAIVYRTCLYGTTFVCHDGFDTDKIIQDIKEYSITQMSLVPIMLKRLINQIPSDHTLRFILLGGAAAGEELLRKAQQRNLPVVPTYGMTETTSQFATSTVELAKQKPKSVGKPLLFSSVKILEPDPNGIGEILVKGPVVTKGYDNKVTKFSEEGYFPTGDMGYRDNDGDLFIVQRRTDLIISGGENIYPSEVERELSRIEGVDAVCVIGIEDERWGQRPIAVLETTESLSVEQIIETLRSTIAGYKIPRQYYLISEFPRTASGKIIRSELVNLIDDLDELDDN